MITLTAAEKLLFADEPPDPLAWFRERLLAHRAARGLSQANLALAAGIDPAHLCRILAGGRNPTRHIVGALARALELDRRDTEELTIAAGFVPDGIDRDTLCRALDLAREGR